MLMEHKDDETIMLFPLQDYATSSRKFFCKGYCTPLLGILWRGLQGGYNEEFFC
jgi:hypothetical protein